MVAVAAARRRYILTVRASDDNSGVARLQIASSPTARHPVTVGFHTRIGLASLAGARWVRVIDRAGNYARWLRVRVR